MSNSFPLDCLKLKKDKLLIYIDRDRQKVGIFQSLKIYIKEYNKIVQNIIIII